MVLTDYERHGMPIRFVGTHEQYDLSRKDLEPYIGARGRVSEVLNNRRSLTLRMIRRLHEGLKIPYESLIQ